MQRKRVFSAADVLALKRIGDVQISPDGSHVAFTLQSASHDGAQEFSSILITDLSTGLTCSVTGGDYFDAVPRWSPNGGQLAFISDRGSSHSRAGRGARNLFLVDPFSGCSIRQLTEFEDAVSSNLVLPITYSLAWSPDGEFLCCSAKGPVAADDLSDDGRIHYETAIVRVYDQLPYKSGEQGWLDGRYDNLWMVSLRGGKPKQLTSIPHDTLEPTFSPDGTLVAFTSCEVPTSLYDVWVTRADGTGSPRRLTKNDGPNRGPSFSPDGERIAYFGHHHRYGGFSRNIHLWVQDLEAPEPSGALDVLEGWDYTAGSIVMSEVHHVYAAPPAKWTADGSQLLFLGTVRGAANLYAVSSRGGTPRAITTGSHEVITASFDHAGDGFAALLSSVTKPPDVYVGRAQSGIARRLTGVNDDLLCSTRVADAEPIHFVSRDGLQIEGLVIKPPGFSRKQRYPLLVQLLPGAHFVHGYSFSQEYQLLAGRGYIVLQVNPRGSGSYGESFAAYATGPDPQLPVTDVDDVLEGVNVVVGQGYVDESRMGLTGEAYGGELTNWIIGHDNRFSAAVARRSVSDQLSYYGSSDRGGPESMLWYEFGCVDPYSDVSRYLRVSPLSFAHNVRTPLLLIHSEGDLRTPLSQSEEMFVALCSVGTPARLMIYANDTHFLSRLGTPAERALLFSAVADWFDTYLGG